MDLELHSKNNNPHKSDQARNLDHCHFRLREEFAETFHRPHSLYRNSGLPRSVNTTYARFVFASKVIPRLSTVNLRLTLAIKPHHFPAVAPTHISANCGSGIRIWLFCGSQRATPTVALPNPFWFCSDAFVWYRRSPNSEQILRLS